MAKVDWEGEVTAVQPRIRLNRSFDERSHSYLGFSLRIDGRVDGEPAVFWVGIGKAAQAKFQCQTGMTASGKANAVTDPRLERDGYYKVSQLMVAPGSAKSDTSSPPWEGVPPTLETYRSRGHRRLSTKTYEAHCDGCQWACRMPVIMTVDRWNSQQKQYRFETFCYGPTACSLYNAGPTRTVPGRNGIVWEERDCVDAEATAHRAPNV